MKILLISWLIQAAVFASDQPPIDANRPFLDKLRSRNSVKYTDFIYPFLLAQMGSAVDQPTETVAGWVRTYLEKGRLPLPSHYGPPTAAASLELPQVLRVGKQLEAIQTCKEEKCQVKLNIELEKKPMQASADKVKTFQELVNKRLVNYHQKRDLLAYEDRRDNQEYVRKMIEEFPFFSARYPEVAKFFSEGFWKKAAAPKGLTRSWMKQELVDLAPDRMQPIWRVSEVFEIKHGDHWIFFEVHVYSNHYLDSSIRIYEVFPAEKRAIVVLTDIMEIDELTKSGLIRMLYKGKMEEAVIEAQTQDVKAFLR